MKKMMSLILVALMAISALPAAFAAEATTTPTTAAQSPAQVVSTLSGQPLEDILNLKMTGGKTYGEIAKELGVLDAFKAASLESKTEMLNAQVTLGKITREEADQLIKALTEAQAACDGTGSTSIGKNAKAGFGQQQGGKNRNTQGNGDNAQGNRSNGRGNNRQGGRHSQNGGRGQRNNAANNGLCPRCGQAVVPQTTNGQ